MISNRLRPIVYGWKTILILLYLKIFHNAVGWKYFFNSFDNFRFDSGKISLLGNNWIEQNTLLHCSGGNINIGARTFINRSTIIVSKTCIDIGDDVLIGDHVAIYDHDHKFNNVNSTISCDKYSSSKVIISSNVWIGTHATILKGVYIGNNSVVAAGSVVTKNIPENELWGGIPAKYIKKLNK